MRAKTLAIVAAMILVAALAGTGYYAYNQYRDSRVDVIETLAGDGYFYGSSMPLTPISTLPPAVGEPLATQLRDAMTNAEPDFRITAEFLATAHSSGGWNRIEKIMTGNYQYYGFAWSDFGSTSVDGANADYALFDADGVIRRIFDHRVLAVVAIPREGSSEDFALGFFELTPSP